MSVKNRNRPLFYCAIVLTICLTGCAKLPPRESLLGKLSIGMEKQLIIDLMDDQDIHIYSSVDEFGNSSEILEYNNRGRNPWAYFMGELYWLYFKNGKLIKWCNAGDQHEIEKNHEMKVELSFLSDFQSCYNNLANEFD